MLMPIRILPSNIFYAMCQPLSITTSQEILFKCNPRHTIFCNYYYYFRRLFNKFFLFTPLYFFFTSTKENNEIIHTIIYIHISLFFWARFMQVIWLIASFWTSPVFYVFVLFYFIFYFLHLHFVLIANNVKKIWMRHR